MAQLVRASAGMEEVSLNSSPDGPIFTFCEYRLLCACGEAWVVRGGQPRVAADNVFDIDMWMSIFGQSGKALKLRRFSNGLSEFEDMRTVWKNLSVSTIVLGRYSMFQPARTRRLSCGHHDRCVSRRHSLLAEGTGSSDDSFRSPCRRPGAHQRR